MPSISYYWREKFNVGFFLVSFSLASLPSEILYLNIEKEGVSKEGSTLFLAGMCLFFQ